MKARKWIASLLAAAVVGFVGHSALSQSISSLKLTDTIGSRGVGDISLLKDMNAPQIEAFRAANDASLVFAVDVNEAADGFEKSSSQGVAVEAAWIEAVFPGSSVPRVYGKFSTQTQALVAPSGSTTRQIYYTLLGDAGSSRITSSSKIGNQYFDSTLKVEVPDSLANATSIVLKVRLLNVNDRAGEPENFYDFSGGFEDLAILVPADAAYFDRVLPQEVSFRQEAPAMELSPEGQATQTALLEEAATREQEAAITQASTSLSWVAQPATGAFQVLAYEDLMPSRGDYDFNDAVIGFRYSLGLNAAGLVERVQGEAVLVARGSNYTHHWTLELALPVEAAAGARSCTTTDSADAPAACELAVEGGLLRWTAFRDSRNILPVTDASRPQRNTFAGQVPLKGPRATFSITFETPVPLASVGVPDPALYVVDTGQTVRNASRDPAGYPFVLAVPSGWRVPIESMDVGNAYPTLMTFLSTGGSSATDWYLAPAGGKVVDWTVQP